MDSLFEHKVETEEEVIKFFVFDVIGKQVGGEVTSMWANKNKFGQVQRCFMLKQIDGSFVKVGVNCNKVHDPKTGRVQIGDRFGVKFASEKMTGKPSPCKIYEFFWDPVGERVEGQMAKDLKVEE